MLQLPVHAIQAAPNRMVSRAHGRSHAEILPESDLHSIPSLLNDDEIGDRAQYGEISGERG